MINLIKSAGVILATHASQKMVRRVLPKFIPGGIASLIAVSLVGAVLKKRSDKSNDKSEKK